MQRCLVFRFLKKRAKEREIEEKRGVSRVCKVREAGGLDQGPLSPPPPLQENLLAHSVLVFSHIFRFVVLFRVLSG